MFSVKNASSSDKEQEKQLLLDESTNAAETSEGLDHADCRNSSSAGDAAYSFGLFSQPALCAYRVGRQ